MKTSILRYEELAINAFPVLLTEVYDGWILRYANGYTYRGNSVNPIYLSSMDKSDKIKQCEEKYVSKGLPCIFKMTETVEEGLDQLLETMGYEIQKYADIMSVDLNKVYSEEEVSIEKIITNEWLEQFVVLNGTTEEPMKTTAKTMLKQIGNEILCASMYKEGRMVACALGVIEDKQVGIYDVRVLEDYRRQGLATQICKGIMSEAYRNGVHHAYLQVASDNDVAIKLYQKLAFKKEYTYWYRIKGMQKVED